MHVCLALTRIPCDCIFEHLIILAYAEHELVAIMTALIHHCRIMKMIPHKDVFSVIVFSRVVYATMPMRQHMFVEWQTPFSKSFMTSLGSLATIH